MQKTKNRKRLIYSTREFERAYLPKTTKRLEIPAGNSTSDFGVNLAKRITGRIKIKV